MKAQLAHWIYRLAGRLGRDQRGAIATEYSIVLGFLVLATMAGIFVLGTAINGHHGDLATDLSAALDIF